ncbi:MAG TPA: PQQ-dependent sugar dehydrogenase [Polyangiaceae bacterium]|nr:PQQ-dependent sugar dehydrogenase [Polyangiaceae bacterium]
MSNLTWSKRRLQLPFSFLLMGAVSFAGALACSKSAPGTGQGQNTMTSGGGQGANNNGAGGQTGNNTGAGGTSSGGMNQATGGSTVVATGGMSTGGGGGSVGVLQPCTDCVEFGLDARPANTTCLAGDPPPQAYKFTQIWQGVTKGTALGVIPTPDGTTLMLIQKNGVALAIPKDTAATDAQVHTFLDLTPEINTDAESGLLNMAFHPDYATNHYVYVIYTRNDGNHSTRLARFTSLDGGMTLDLTTEATVLEHTQIRGTHHGGGLAFGPDGYLYASFGDNNTGDDHTDGTAADWTKRYGSMVRLDVNVPGDGFNVPPDNPHADGVMGAPEVFAKGLRNPWRFSFDSMTGDIWLADPGEEVNGNVGNCEDTPATPYERVEIVTNGGYYGWPYWQGTHCYHDGTPQNKGAPPELELSHDGAPWAIVGGYVYRGQALPGLTGQYIYGNYESGEAWAYERTGKTKQSLGNGGKIVSFGQDNDGEIYALREGGQVDQLVNSNTGQAGGFPQMLSQTGCVDPADPTKPATGLIPYTVAVPFWSDGVHKDRYVAVPDGKTIDVATDGDFTLPPGGVTMKNFSYQNKLFETRFFVRHNDGSYYGYSYEWNAAGTDATLVPPEGKSVTTPLNWSYPGTSQCFTCHNEAAGRSLGLETRQFNSIETYPSGMKANQLNTMNHIGLLSGTTTALDPYIPLDDTTVPLDVRARSYLAVNCSNCHRPGGPGRGQINALFDTAFADTHLCNQMPDQGDLGVTGATLLTPGDHTKSILWLRMSQRTMNFMPPLASKIPDMAGADLLAQWIDGLQACP